jgi:hypothetical protein
MALEKTGSSSRTCNAQLEELLKMKSVLKMGIVK